MSVHLDAGVPALASPRRIHSPGPVIADRF